MRSLPLSATRMRAQVSLLPTRGTLLIRNSSMTACAGEPPPASEPMNSRGARLCGGRVPVTRSRSSPSV